MLRKSLTLQSSSVKKMSTQACIKADEKFAAHNYAPLPVVVAKGRGVHVWDPEGKHYYDFLAGYGAVNFGHCNPRITRAAKKQLETLTLCSRAFHSDKMGLFCERLGKATGYEKVLLMNTGAEAIESAVKLARAWGYAQKGIPQDKAVVIGCTGNFHGRGMSAVAMTDELEHRKMFGPILPGFVTTPFGDADALDAVFEKYGKNACAFIVEPIQGEAGVVIPPAGFLPKVRRLCDKYKVALMCDEVQSGMCRTGKLLAQEHEGVRADITMLAKAIGGGVVPLSAVVTDQKFMQVLTPGTHGSTFGGNPLACAVGLEVLDVIREERILPHSVKVGRVMNAHLQNLAQEFPVIKAVRNRGMWGAIEVRHDVLNGMGGKLLAKKMIHHGVLSKVTHDHTLRLSPPLIMTEKQMTDAFSRIHSACKAVFGNTKP
jgi:ornithine--oxo-acid transaminase